MLDQVQTAEYIYDKNKHISECLVTFVDGTQVRITDSKEILEIQQQMSNQNRQFQTDYQIEHKE